MSLSSMSSHIYSARLIRLLADQALVAPDVPGAALAEKWAAWIDVASAIKLAAVLADSSPQNHVGGQTTVSLKATTQSLEAQFAAVADPLASRIDSACSPQARGRLTLPTDGMSDFATYRRVYHALQGDMALHIPPLRRRVRAALQAVPVPTLQALATLDQSLEENLAERENRLLSSMVLLLEKPFAEVVAANAADAAAVSDREYISRRLNFHRLIQTLLHAELELRLLPVRGLIEAVATMTEDQPRLNHEDIATP